MPVQLACALALEQLGGPTQDFGTSGGTSCATSRAASWVVSIATDESEVASSPGFGPESDVDPPVDDPESDDAPPPPSLRPASGVPVSKTLSLPPQLATAQRNVIANKAATLRCILISYLGSAYPTS